MEAGYFIMKLLAEAGLPEGVINFVPGDGAAADAHDMLLVRECPIYGSYQRRNGSMTQKAECLLAVVIVLLAGSLSAAGPSESTSRSSSTTR